MQFRIATPADAPAIAALHAANWQIAYRGLLSDHYLDHDIASERAVVWSERFSQPAANQYIVVAEDQQRIVGFCCALGGEDPLWGTLLDNLHVAASHKGQGLGTRLIEHIAAWSQQHYPAIPLHLWVLEGNRAARAFYEKLGAHCAESGIWEPPGGGSVTELRYVWPAPLRRDGGGSGDSSRIAPRR